MGQGRERDKQRAPRSLTLSPALALLNLARGRFPTTMWNPRRWVMYFEVAMDRGSASLRGTMMVTLILLRITASVLLKPVCHE